MKGKKLLLPLAAFGLLFGLAACNNGSQSESKKSEESQQSSVQPSSEATPASSQADTSTPEQESSEQPSSPAVQPKITVEGADGVKKITGIGKTLQLTAKADGEALTGVTWASANTSVVTVDANGLVTSVAKGSAKITADKDGYQQGTFSVMVELEKIVVSAADNKTSLVMEETVQLSAAIGEQAAQGVT